MSRSKGKSDVTGGTKTEREVLALLIERGILATFSYSEVLSENHNLIPQSSEPIENAGFSLFFGMPCYYLNAIGYAVLGLEGDCYELIHAYREQLMRSLVTKYSRPEQPYAAVADMLGLPFDLLWETEFQTSMGLLIPGIIEELRRD